MHRVIRQTWRGCFRLPGVGPHPGRWVVVLMLPAFGLAGGWAGFALATVFFVPLFLMGAYERARVSDMLLQQTAERVLEWTQRR